MNRVFLTGEPYLSSDEVFVRKDGTLFPISVITSPVREEGRIRALVTAFRDISARKAGEREQAALIAELQAALATIRTLSGILPICSSCKRIRDEQGSWNHIEVYISQHSNAEFSHGLCQDCAAKIYPDHYRRKNNGD
jgi:hypothetical protein